MGGDKPVTEAAARWAAGVGPASASGYNNGSIMNPGRHWASADDFVIADGQGRPWAIDSLRFLCGTDLEASLERLRVSIYADAGGGPDAWTAPLWRYEEALDSLSAISVTSEFVGGTWNRWLHHVAVDLTGMGVELQSNTTYYLSIEGDCVNTADTHNGWDTYYQRCYTTADIDPAASGQVNGNYWYTGLYPDGWSAWTPAAGDLVFGIDGHAVPEPSVVCLMLLGMLGQQRRCRLFETENRQE